MTLRQLIPALLLVAGCGDPVTVGPLDRPLEFTNVSAGVEHTCAIDTDGALWCWGRENWGRLAFASDAAPCVGDVCTEPVRALSGVPAARDIAAGLEHTCVIGRETPYCWGSGFWGQLGDGDTIIQRCDPPDGGFPQKCSIVPRPAALGFAVTDVTVGANHSCAVTTTGDAYCWGFGKFGQLGVSKDSALTPVKVQGGHRFTSISAGASHTCALDADGAAWCWGADVEGRLGTGKVIPDTPVPTRVAGGHRFAQIDLGEAHTCAVTTAGKPYCWGAGWAGQIGDDLLLSWPFPYPVVLPDSSTRVTHISAGGAHTCMVTTDGKLYCSGLNNRDQLGDGSRLNQRVPRLVQEIGDVASVTAGHRHTCVLDTRNRLYCWGSGSAGQLGLGSLSDAPFPLRVAGPRP